MPREPKKIPTPTVTVSEQLAPERMTDEDWFNDRRFDGQLAVDVYQTPTSIVIVSPIAGVAAGDIDVAVNRDVVTIRGRRQQSTDEAGRDYLFQECYWGGFSRSVILPVEVDVERVNAELKNGILTVTLPKAKSATIRVIPVGGDE